DAFDEVEDSNDNATSLSTMSIQNNSETDEFITPPKNFGVHWTGFLCLKQVKNTKSRQYNAKCLYCNKIFEARKEAMIHHIINICQKILAKDKILYMQNINKKNSANIIKSYPNEDLDISSKKRKAVLTDFFNKTMIPSDKIDELHTLLLRSLIYTIESSLKNMNLNFNKIIALVMDSPSIIIRLRKNVSEKYQHIVGSTYWNAKLKQWATDNNIIHNLQTFCETQWFSFLKVCLLVQNYEEGFKACLEYNNKFSNECPVIPVNIKEIVTS
ncbi:7228_t:CDS:2, partial [Dentiscutata heterogama]